MSAFDSKVIMPDTLCRSRHYELARFHDYITSNRGVIDERFAEFMPLLSICKPTERFETAPPIILIGRKSEQKKLFKQCFGQDIAATRATPDPELERASAHGYEYAMRNGMFCQECFSLIETPSGPMSVFYLRYIARYQEPGGPPLLAYISTHLNPSLH